MATGISKDPTIDLREYADPLGASGNDLQHVQKPYIEADRKSRACMECSHKTTWSKGAHVRRKVAVVRPTICPQKEESVTEVIQGLQDQSPAEPTLLSQEHPGSVPNVMQSGDVLLDLLNSLVADQEARSSRRQPVSEIRAEVGTDTESDSESDTNSDWDLSSDSSSSDSSSDSSSSESSSDSTSESDSSSSDTDSESESD